MAKLYKKSKHYCPHCNKITMHIPKFGLVLQGCMKCSKCLKINKIL